MKRNKKGQFIKGYYQGVGFKKGQKHTDEIKRKISESNKGKKKKPWTEERKIRFAKSRLRGEKSHLWKGGIAKENKIKYSKKWRENNRGRVLILNSKRRALKSNAIGSHTFGEWQTLKAQYNWTCPCCHQQEPEVKLTQDHIIPLVKGGSDNIENIQPLCRSCNSKKHDKVVKYIL